MGQSAQILDGRHEVFEDIDLLLVVRLAILAARNDEADEWLAEAWSFSYREHAPGVVDLGLRAIVANPENRASLLRVLSVVEDNLHAVGAVIPLASLKSDLKLPGVRFRADQDSGRIVSTLLRLRALIEGNAPRVAET